MIVSLLNHFLMVWVSAVNNPICRKTPTERDYRARISVRFDQSAVLVYPAR
jgi:hypothetical protein